MSSLRKLRKDERGQELVEFAIILPFLLLVAFGVLDLGRIFHAAITITNAAREGARYGTFYPDDAPGIIAATRSEAANSGIDLSTSLIQVSCPQGCDSGFPLRVTVVYDFELIMGLVFPSTNMQFARYAEMMVP
jgi:Flp pilus assembly protein TadG